MSRPKSKKKRAASSFSLFETNAIDNATTSALKMAAASRVPSKWIVPASFIETEDEVRERDPLVVVTLLLQIESELTVEAFADRIVRPGGFTLRDAVNMFHMTPLPGQPRYTSLRDTQMKEPDLARLNLLYEERSEQIYYTSVDAMEDRFSVWKEELAKKVDEEWDRLQRVVRQQDTLLRLEPYTTRNYVIEESTLHIPFETEMHPYEFFSTMSVSSDIPFLKWVPLRGDETKQSVAQRIQAASTELDNLSAFKAPTMKVWEGLSHTRVDVFTAALQLPTLRDTETAWKERKTGSVILGAVFTGKKEDESRQKGIKDKYALFTFHFPLNGNPQLSFRTMTDSEEDTQARILSTLPFSLSIEPSIRTRISGSFEMTGGHVLDTFQAFLMLIMVEPTLHDYFYIEESAHVQTDKQRFTLQMRANWHAKGDEETKRSALSATLSKKLCCDREDWFEIKVARAASARTVELFMEIIRRVVRFVSTQSTSITRLLSTYIPPIKTTLKSKVTEELRRSDLAPDVFVPGYAKKCQKKAKPTLIQEDEMEAWERRGHQVMRYPPPDWPHQPQNGPLYLVCDYPDRKYPGVSDAKDLPNADRFPYYPCCYFTDQMKPSANSFYNKWYRGRKRKATYSRLHVIITEKALDPGRMGSVNPIVHTLLSEEEGDDFVRLGTDEDPDYSALHGLLLATQDPKYLETTTEKQRNKVVRDTARTLIATYPSHMLPSKLPMDLMHWTRVLESYFDVNLFVLDGSTLKIPAFTFLFTRTERLDRPSVLLSISKRTTGIYYDLVTPLVEGEAQTDRALFGEEITRRLFEIQNQLIQFTHAPLRNVDLESAFSSFGEIKAQKIDQTGHVRAIVVSGEKYGVLHDVLIGTWPSEPLNVPEMDAVPPLPPLENVVRLHGPYDAIDVANDRVVGVGYELGDAWFSVPVQPHHVAIDIETQTFPVIPSPSQHDDIERKGRIVYMIFRWMLWVWVHSTPNASQSASRFFSKRIDIQAVEYVAPSLFRLPSPENDAWKVAQDIFPSLFGSRIRLPSLKFRDRILHLLQRVMDTHGHASLQTWTLLGPSQTHVKNETLVFQSESLFLHWFAEKYRRYLAAESNKVDSLLASRATGTVLSVKHITPETLQGSTLPIPFDPDQRAFPPEMYLIQNVLNGEIERAFTVCLNWNDVDINPGFFAAPAEFDAGGKPVYELYDLSATGILTLVESTRMGDEPFCRLIRYETNKFAAALTLK